MLDELYSHEHKGWQLGLDRIRELLLKIGNPQDKLKCIHVAGTNGKGSVCAFIDSILRNAGYKVGLYTSPHLIKFNERIKINGKEISDKEIVEYYLRIKKNSEGIFFPSTFFEIATAMAFLYFAQKKADFVVLEVGLGGRLDATNVVKPVVCVITNVGLEHSDYLGDSVEKIAFEKAGIIKEGVPVVTGCKGKSLEVVKRIARERNAEVYFPLKAVKTKKGLSIGSYDNLEIGIRGEFQIGNAAIALTAVELIKDKLGIYKDSIRQGLANARWPGRLEFVKKNILADCAHNYNGMKVLAREIGNMKIKDVVLVIGILKDKDIRGMMKIILPFAREVILTKPASDRAESPAALAEFVNGKDAFFFFFAEDAVGIAKKISGKNRIVLITGSIYLVGKAISLIKRK